MKEAGLKNKIALVTGSRRGIGRAVAMALADAGADVIVCDLVLDDGKLNEAVEAIKALGRRSAAFKVDISDKAQVESTVEQSARMFGRIDILVNCAGVWIPGETLLDCNDDDWNRVIDTNLRGTYFCCRSVGRMMVKQKEGNIINLSSQVGLNPGAGGGAYSISKAGIIMLTRQLALRARTLQHKGQRARARHRKDRLQRRFMEECRYCEPDGAWNTGRQNGRAR